MIIVHKITPPKTKKPTTADLKPGTIFTWGRSNDPITFPHTHGVAIKLDNGYAWLSDRIGKPVFKHDTDKELHNIIILGTLNSIEVF